MSCLSTRYSLRAQWRDHLAILIPALVFFSACATPVGVVRVDPQRVYVQESASVLSTGEPSSFSVIVLKRLNLYEQFNAAPEETLQRLHQGLSARDDEDRLFALAELCFFHAGNNGDRTYYLASAVYAYAFLFPEGFGASPNPADIRFRLALDLYNRAIAQGFAFPNDGTVLFQAGRYHLPFGSLSVEMPEGELLWGGYRMTDFVPAANYAIRGLRNRYRRPGIGAAVGATLVPTELTSTRSRISSQTKVAITAVLRLDDARRRLLNGDLNGALELYPAELSASIKIGGMDLSLESEISWTIAYGLEGAPVWDFEIAGFRSGDFSLLGEQKFTDRLYFTRPHRAGRIPVVLIHGTASSPARWAEMINELLNDPRIYDHYDLWYFMYNTGNPITYTASLLHAALADAVEELDPNGNDAGLRRMVLVGHSQGGLLAKMMVIDTGDRLWRLISDARFEEIDVTEQMKEDLKRSLFFKPLPFVSRVLFIATPHRGSYQALGYLSDFVSWLIRMPREFLRFAKDLATLEARGLLRTPFERIPNSVDMMNPRRPFVGALAEIPIDPSVVAHSIIGVRGGGPPEDGNDGFVQYRSAHMEGAASEKIVRSGHSMQGHPDTIEEVRRILLEHLNAP
jgi:pimeloyl-ACP methyl ester carboxylesterase